MEDAGTIALPVIGQHTDAWQPILVLPYGPTEETLGTSPGHDDVVGPEYGTQAPDGTWWLLDSAKSRLAHYDVDGHYLGAVELGEDELAGGRYFHWQHLRALDDGTLVATSFTDERTNLLTVADGEAATAVASEHLVTVVADDGQHLYGIAGQGAFVRIDPSRAETSSTEWMRTRSGARYSLTLSGHHLELRMPDLDPPVARRWALVSAPDEHPVQPVLEVATDADGRVHMLLYGTTETSPDVQLAAYVRLGLDGHVEVSETTPELFSPADPGGPSHLGVSPGGKRPWLMVIGDDAVRILQRRS